MATLEQLEGDVWPAPAPEHATNLVMKCHRLRKQDIATFTPEDVRVLVGQGISLPHMAPLALAILERDPLEEGAMGFPGAMLLSLVRETNWPQLEGWSERVENICTTALGLLTRDIDRETAREIRSYLNRRSHQH